MAHLAFSRAGDRVHKGRCQRSGTAPKSPVGPLFRDYLDRSALAGIILDPRDKIWLGNVGDDKDLAVLLSDPTDETEVHAVGG